MSSAADNSQVQFKRYTKEAIKDVADKTGITDDAQIQAMLAAGVEDGLDADRWIDQCGISDPEQIRLCIEAYDNTPGAAQVSASEWIAKTQIAEPSEIRSTLWRVYEQECEYENNE